MSLEVFKGLAALLGAWAVFFSLTRACSAILNPRRYRGIMANKSIFNRLNDVLIPTGLLALALSLALHHFFPT